MRPGPGPSVPMLGPLYAPLRRQLRMRSGVLARFAVFTATLGLVLLTATPATAHSALLSTDPADGAKLTAAPASTQFVFSQDVLPSFAQVTIAGPDGAVTRLETTINGATVHAAVPTSPPLTAGLWTLAYRITAKDGHPITGTTSFTLTSQAGSSGPSGPSPAATGSLLPSAPDRAATSAPATPLAVATTGPARGGKGSRPDLSGFIWAGAGFLVAGLVVVAYEIRQRRRAPSSRPSEGGAPSADQ